MAREIKFRAKPLNDDGTIGDHWIYGSSDIELPNERRAMLHLVDDQLTLQIIADASSFQYTGLKDKNGVEIWEGDIVAATYIPYDGDPKRHSPITKESVMEYGKIASDSREYDDDIAIGFDFPFAAKSDLSNCEVIGNIYEDPELLEHSS